MNKQVILTIITFVLAVTLSTIGFSCGPSEPSQFLTYTDEANGFSIDYPQGWEVEPKKSSQLRVAIWSNKLGINAAGILVAKYDTPGYSLEDFFKLRIESLVDTTKDYVSVSTEKLTVNNIPAIKHTFTETIISTQYTIVEICFVKNGIGWILRFPCPQKSVDSYESTFEIALNSFLLLK